MKNKDKDLFDCSNLALYCSFYSVDIADVREDPEMADYMERHRAALEQLISGYHELGNLNQEICNEYLGVDCPYCKKGKKTAKD